MALLFGYFIPIATLSFASYNNNKMIISAIGVFIFGSDVLSVTMLLMLENSPCKFCVFENIAICDPIETIIEITT